MLLDISESARPDAKTRRLINESLAAIATNVKHCGFFTGKNVIINTAIRFVMYGTGIKNYSVSKTREEALKAIHAAQ